MIPPTRKSQWRNYNDADGATAPSDFSMRKSLFFSTKFYTNCNKIVEKPIFLKINNSAFNTI